MTAYELRVLTEHAAASRIQTVQARKNRDMAIHQALAEGWTQRQIAEATGLSAGRIGQIAGEPK